MSKLKSSVLLQHYQCKPEHDGRPVTGIIEPFNQYTMGRKITFSVHKITVRYKEIEKCKKITKPLLSHNAV